MPDNLDNTTISLISSIKNLQIKGDFASFIIEKNNIKAFLNVEKFTNINLQNYCIYNFNLRLQKPFSYVNEGGQSNLAHSLQQNLYAFAKVENIKFIECKKQDNLREKILEKVKVANLPILETLIFADNSLSNSQLTSLQKSGTLHLLVVSGAHLSLLAAIVLFICKYSVYAINKIFNQNINFWPVFCVATIVFCSCYSFLANFTAPVSRSLLIIIFLCLSRLFLKQIHLILVLNVAFYVLSISNIANLLLPGFYLSFIASFIIIYVSIIKFPTHTIISQTISVQLFVSFGLLPIFSIFSLPSTTVSLLANLIAIPFVSFLLLPLSFLNVLLILCNLKLNFLLVLNDFLSFYLFYILEYISSFAVLFVLPNSLFLFLAIFLIFLPIPGRLLFVSVLFYLFFSNNEMQNQDLKISIFDIGQGNAILIQTKNQNILYDAAPKLKLFDAGENILSPILRSKQIKQIDKLIISHEDLDHAGGKEAILNSFQVQEVVDSRNCTQQESQIIDGVEFDFWQYTKAQSDNDASCVLLLTIDGRQVLLTGDISQDIELIYLDYLQKQHKLINIEALLIAHHGSLSSSNAKFLANIKAKFAFISAGRYNRFNHPSPKVIERLKELNIEIYQTPKMGQIIYEIKDKQSKIYTLEQEKFIFKMRHYFQ